MTSQKGYETLMHALKILLEDEIPFHCFVAGDGPLRQKIEKMRIDFGLDHHLTFLGWIKQVPEFLSALDILVMPSNFEGLGTLILDGTYAGCCVAASDVGGIPEMIIHEKTGLLSPVGGAEVLAENLKDLISNSDKCSRLVSAARDHINKNFSLSSMVTGNLQVYSEII
jgi:glycosyltransferase involved in cell wall biosynthesis